MTGAASPQRRSRSRSRVACAALVCLLAAPIASAEPRSTPGLAERIEYRESATAPARGPASALVMIEVFFIPGSNLPGTTHRLLQQLQDRHPTRIRLIYRILKGPSQLLVPCAALEAHAEGKFFALMDELGKPRATFKKDDVAELARKVGLDPQRAALAAQLEQYRDLLDANQRRFERLHLGNNPSVLFNGKPTRVALGTITTTDLEREYEAAYDRAIDKLDRGFAQDQLAAAFDDEAMWAAPPIVVSAGARGDPPDRSLLDHPLANPPLKLDGLPSLGKPGTVAATPIVVLCRPNDATCSNLLLIMEAEIRRYPDEVRAVWAPWFDVARDDAVELTLLGDAALCAEAIGSSQGELTTSPGWLWVTEMYAAQANRSHGKKPVAEALIDAVADRRHVDSRALSACRARMASTTLSWIAAARRAGAPRANAAVVIGGRIYDGLTDPMLIQELVEAELAPGVLGSLPRWHTGK